MGAIVAMQPQNTEAVSGDLGEAERLFLWLIRTWVQGLNQSIDIDHEIQTGLMAHGIPDAATAVDGLMMAIATCASRNLDIRRRRTSAISSDEVILLRAFGAMSAELRPLAEAVLALMVDGTGSRIAAENLQRLSDRFASAALVPMPFQPLMPDCWKQVSQRQLPQAQASVPAVDRLPSAGRMPDAS
ncbi:MAG: hypothetical protein P1U65_06795 [Minwuia sp.]|nr:hypothetical protein [Minwuia sp.]